MATTWQSGEPEKVSVGPTRGNSPGESSSDPGPENSNNKTNNNNAGGSGHVSGQSNKPLTHPAHALTYCQLAQELGADPLSGLSPDEAKKLLSEFGRNELDEAEGVQPIKIIIAQVANAMTMVLILAMGVSFGIGFYIEGGVVATVILVNVVVRLF